MSVKPYDSKKIRSLIDLYWNTYPEPPTKTDQIYINEDAIMWDGYIKPVEELRELFSGIFRLNPVKQKIDVKSAQEPNGTEDLNIRQIAFFVTDILVNEKTHQGLFSVMLKMGVIERIIQRLEILLSEPTKSWWKR